MPIQRNHILVPLDFSPQSLIALEQANNVAQLTKADVTLIHVLEESFFSMPFFSQSEKVKADIEKKLQKELERIAKESNAKTSCKTDTSLVHGKVYEEIQKAARQRKSSLIIMGTNGSTGLKKFIGSNALRVIREAPCSVITIKGKKHMKGCANILLPLDLTKETKEKVSKAIEFAKVYHSVVNLMSVINTDDEFIINKLKRQMSQVNDYVTSHGVSATTAFIEGEDISTEILKHAKQIKADLIMIMTQEEMDWTDMFIGSEAQQVINDSDIPVLSIRPMHRKYSDVFSI